MKYLATVFLITLLLINGPLINGQAWESVGSGVSDGVSVTRVNVLKVLNNELLVGGDFKFADTVTANSIAKWNGAQWNSIGNGLGKVTYRGTLAIEEYNDELYAGGDFIDSTSGGEILTLMKWNGNDWVSVLSPFDGAVEVLNLYNNELYVAGGGINPDYIAKWNGTEWNEVGNDVNAPVFDMQGYNNELYVGGMFTDAGGVNVNGIAKWNGSEWLSTGLEQFLNDSRQIFLECFTIYKNNLIAGVSLGIETNLLAKWNGSEWNIIDSSFNGQILALTEFNNELYAGGSFDSVGGQQVNHIAKWNDTTWSPVNGGMNNYVYSLTVYNNELYAGGIFTEAGSVAASRIARLTSPVGVKEESENLPKDYELYQNYPNPFNPSTKISWQSPIGSWQTLKIFDVLGREVATLVNEERPAGKYEEEFDASSLPSGTYFYRLQTREFSETKKFVLLR